MNPCALFANFENPFGDTRRAFQEAVTTVIHAETLGFDQVWMTEHHFNRFSISASIFPLLAHLAGRTRHIALGAGVVLLPFHDPVRVAEDAATVDALSGGRLLLGLGKGGPFPDQFRHFGVAPEVSRDRLIEGLDLLEKLFAGTAVDHRGTHFHYTDLSVYPRPLRPRLPIWLASQAPESVALAARRGHGLMGPSAAPVERMQALVQAYRACRPAVDQPLVLARYFLCHEDRDRARAEALPFIRDFGRNMGSALIEHPTATPGRPALASPDEGLLANAIVGDPAACIDRCRALADALGPHILLLKPATFDPQASRRALTLFAERVRPFLPTSS